MFATDQIVITIVGITLSYPLNYAPSGTIVMIFVAMYVGKVLAKHFGLFSKKTISQENPITGH
jgi:ABC-type Mn2+/Zn2+ transport system permease subunit